MDVPRAIDHCCSITKMLPLNPLPNQDGSAGRTRKVARAVCGINATRTVPAVKEVWIGGADCATNFGGLNPLTHAPNMNNANAAKRTGREILCPHSRGLANRIDN